MTARRAPAQDKLTNPFRAAYEEGYTEQASVSFPFWRQRAVDALIRQETTKLDIKCFDWSKSWVVPIVVIRARSRSDISEIAAALSPIGNVVSSV